MMLLDLAFCQQTPDSKLKDLVSNVGRTILVLQIVFVLLYLILLLVVKRDEDIWSYLPWAPASR